MTSKWRKGRNETKRNERAVNFIKISFLNLKMKQAEKRKEKERARIF